MSEPYSSKKKYTAGIDPYIDKPGIGSTYFAVELHDNWMLPIPDSNIPLGCLLSNYPALAFGDSEFEADVIRLAGFFTSSL